MSDCLDRDPGIYDLTPDALALTDQQRAEAIAALRTADAVSVTWLDKHDNATHWAFCTSGEHEDRALTFLVFVVCKAWRDAQPLSGMDDVGFAALVLSALEEGVGA